MTTSDTPAVHPSGLLAGKRGLIIGVANHRSIAWAIAQAAHHHGASLTLTYQNERVERSVRDLAATLAGPAIPVLPCDLTNEPQVDALFQTVAEAGEGLDFLVHAVAFAQKEDLEDQFVTTSRAGFQTALDISAYTLTAAARQARPLLARNGGSIITLTYLGSERVLPHYNVMGVAKAALEASVRYLAADLGPEAIRVNAISAGPIQTLSARGIAGFTEMRKEARTKVPLRRDIEASEVADAAVFLCSDMARAITGEVIYVDAGYHIMGA